MTSRKGNGISKKRGRAAAAADDEESVNDDDSQTGWNSDEDQLFYKSVKGGHDSDDYDEDDEEGGILLSDMIAYNESKRKDSKKDKKAAKVVPKVQQPVYESEEGSEMEDDEDEMEDEDLDEMDAEEDDEDDEEDDDEEMGSDDLDEDEDEDDDEADDEAKQQKLVNAIKRFSNADEATERQKSLQKSFAQRAESSIVAPSKGLGFSALFDGIDTAGLSAMKSQLKDLEKTQQAAPKYVEKVVAARIEREETYAANKEDMGKWHETIMQNRNVTTLDLAQDKRRPHRAKTLVNSFVPTTDFEKEISMVVLKAGATDEAMAKKERELLEASNLTPEEIQLRQAELAKVRALLFYEQMKRHRVNKIKSKAYRTIQRKKRNKADGAAVSEDAEDGEDNEAAAAQREKAAVARIRERMDLKHKNTSKWAKMALQYGHSDKELRDAYHESVRMGHELTRKMHEDVNEDRDSDDEGDGGGVYSDDDEDPQKKKRRISAMAKREIEAAYAEDGNAVGEEVHKGKYRKLFEMDFMKRASEVSRERAKEEAQQVLKEIAAMEDDMGGYDSDYDHTLSSSMEQQQASAAAPVVIAQKKVGLVKKAGLNLDADHDAHQQMLKRAAAAVAATNAAAAEAVAAKKNAVVIEQSHEEEEEEESNPWLEESQAGGRRNSSRSKSGAQKEDVAIKVSTTTNINSVPGAKGAQKRDNGKQQKKTGSSNSNGDLQVIQQVDVLLDKDAVTTSSSNPTTSKASGAVGKKGNKAVAAAPVASELTNDQSGKKRPRSDSTASSSSQQQQPQTGAKKAILAATSQEDLVRQAFSGPDYEAEYQQHKQQTIDAELGLDQKQLKILKDGKEYFVHSDGYDSTLLSPMADHASFVVFLSFPFFRFFLLITVVLMLRVVKAGWGDWAGPGQMEVSPKILAKRDQRMMQVQREHETLRLNRADANLKNVTISEKRIKNAAKYKVAAVPYPFSSREEYERSLQMPVGGEWQASQVVSQLTQPEIKKRAGRIIAPIVLPKKVQATSVALMHKESQGGNGKMRHKKMAKMNVVGRS